MSEQDLFLKISIDVYYPLEGKSVRQETVTEGNDTFNEYYIDGNKVEPEIMLYHESNNDLIEDSSSLGIEIMTREKIWKEDPSFKIMDDLISKHSNSK